MFDRVAETSRTQVKKMRWTLGLHGLASVALGVMILAWPGISVYALTIVFGAYTLATGIVEFGTAFTSQGNEERGWLILRGLLGITVGVLVFAWPGISALALLYVIGVCAVALGILAVAASFRLPLDGRDTTSMILDRLVSIVFGIVIFAMPGAGALTVLALIAAFALVTGVSEFVVAIGGEKLLERKAKKTFSSPRRAGEDDSPAVALTVVLPRPHIRGAGDHSPAPRASGHVPRQRRPTAWHWVGIALRQRCSQINERTCDDHDSKQAEEARRRAGASTATGRRSTSPSRRSGA